MALPGSIEALKHLSQHEMRERLAQERQEIPAMLEMQLHGFITSQNERPGILLKAIEQFEDPEEGFRLFQGFYATDDSNLLRHQIMEANLKPFDGEEKRRGHMDAQLAMIHYAFRHSRAIDDPIYYSGHPYLESCRPLLKELYHEHLLTSLERLLEATLDPLLTRDMLQPYWELMLELSEARFDALANDLLNPPPNARKPLHLSPEKTPPSLTFGVEIEGFFPSAQNTASHIQAAEHVLGKTEFPLNINVQPKEDEVFSKWSVMRDVSALNPLHYRGGIWFGGMWSTECGGIEVVSPILQGEEGIRDVKRVAEELQKNGLLTNHSSGFHLHVGMENTTLDERKNLAKAFVQNEEALDAFVDPSRRGTKLSFARTMQDVSLEEIDAASTTAELVHAVNRGNAYAKLNMTNLDFPGAPQTVEYRAEGGVGYLNHAADYALLLLAFTAQALKNPDITLDKVLESLKPEKSFTADVKTRRAAPPETAATR